MITLITTIVCDRRRRERERERERPGRRCSSSAGYLDTTGSIPAAFFYPSTPDPHLCFSTLTSPAEFFFLFFRACNFLDTCALSFINVGLNITAMTGKLAEKLPLTMSSLINTIPDSLYPEEDIPTSMNIFTSTDSINHYSQMNAGKMCLIFMYLCLCASDFDRSGSNCARCARKATVVLALGAPVCALAVAHKGRSPDWTLSLHARSKTRRVQQQLRKNTFEISAVWLFSFRSCFFHLSGLQVSCFQTKRRKSAPVASQVHIWKIEYINTCLDIILNQLWANRLVRRNVLMWCDRVSCQSGFTHRSTKRSRLCHSNW